MHCMKGEGGVFYYRPNILLAVVCLFLRANKFRYSFIRPSVIQRPFFFFVHDIEIDGHIAERQFTSNTSQA